jgi:RNA polymerase sigma factor (sigma-70 family)
MSKPIVPFNNSDLFVMRYTLPKVDERTKRRLIRQSKKGDRQALELLVRTHLPMIKAIAVKGNFYHDGEDLMSVGIRAFCHAVELYKPTKGMLSTYASVWIKAQVQSWKEKEKGLFRATNQLERNFISWRHKKSDWTPSEVYEEFLRRNPAHNSVTIRAARIALEKCNGRKLSLDRKVNGRKDNGHDIVRLGDLIKDETAVNAEAALIDISDNKRLRQALRRLSPRTQKILMDRFSKDRKMREIGHDLGISRERVRQIEKKGIEDLRAILGDKREAVG